MSNNLDRKQIILYDIDYDINSFMAAPTVFRNLISNDCWNKSKITILQTHKLGFIEKKENNLILNKSFNYSLSYCLKNKLIRKRNIISFCFYKVLSKLQDKFFFVDNLVTFRIYKKIIKQNKIGYIVRGATKNDGLKALIKTKKKLHMNYSVVLTDPVFYFPKNNGKSIAKLEDKLINDSDLYFVPEFCLESYKTEFNSKKIQPLCFPMAIDLDNAFTYMTEAMTFSYFGTQRTNYNIFDNVFLHISSKPNSKLKFYGWTNEKLAKQTCGENLKPVRGELLINEIMKSNFLIAIDNPPHMTDLLPSKIILYASTTKPIIIFGENDDSALLKFLKKIKYERYIYIKPTDSFELLDKFIKEYSNVSFDEECYKRQSDYYPSNVSQYVYNQIFGK